MPSLPPEFHPAFYRATYPDMAALADDEARQHYEFNGRHEGRLASPYATRAGLLSLVDQDARSILEIGPGSRPCFAGLNVRYFDVTDSAGLRARAARAGENVEAVPPHIHYVSPVGDLSIVGADRFDVVVSAHAIEHQPDLQGHLAQVGAVLRPGGLYFAIVPDRRFTFDQSIRRSRVGDVIEAAGRTAHREADVIDAYAISTHNDPARHWAGDSPPVTVTAEKVREALAHIERADGAYIDAHAWRFSSEEMRSTLELLAALELSPFQTVRVFSTPRNSSEVCMILSAEQRSNVLRET